MINLPTGGKHTETTVVLSPPSEGEKHCPFGPIDPPRVSGLSPPQQEVLVKTLLRELLVRKCQVSYSDGMLSTRRPKAPVKPVLGQFVPRMPSYR